MAPNKVTYGAYTFPRVPQVQIAVAWERDEENRRTFRVERWTLTGMLTGSSGTLTAERDALLSAFGADLKKLSFTTNAGANLVDALDPATAYRGPVVESVDAPSDGGGASFATYIPYTIIVVGSVPDPDSTISTDSDVIEDLQTVSFSVDQDRIITKTIRGTIRTVEGVDATTKVLDKDPGMSAPPGETFRSSVRESFEITGISDDGTECEYEFVYRELVTALPSKATSGEVTTTEAVNAQGLKVRTISGWFVGKGGIDDAKDAADAVRPDGPLKTDSISEDKHNRARVNFTFVEETNVHDDEVLEFEETVSLRKSYTQKRWWTRKSGSLPPYRQDIARTPAFITQSGRARGRTAYPEFPALLYTEDDLIDAPQEDRVSPGRGVGDTSGGAVDYVITWRYAFGFAETPEAPTPNTTTSAGGAG